MEDKIILYAWLALVTLAQALLIALKIIAGRNEKEEETKSPGNNPHPCQAHGERLRGLEVDLTRLREDNKDEHLQLRSNIARIFTILNGVKKE
jgi:hypothetical protein